MSSNHPTSEDMSLSARLQAKIRQGSSQPDSTAATAQFLSDNFQGGTRAVDGLRRRYASYSRQRKTMDLAIDRWDDEGGAIATASPKPHRDPTR